MHFSHRSASIDPEWLLTRHVDDMTNRLLSSAVIVFMLASFPGSTALADENAAKTHNPMVARIAVFLNAQSTDPTLKGLRGFTPAEARVHVGDHIIFFNIDTEVHTATVRLAGAFPANATIAVGHNITDAWSTGDLKPNGESPDLGR